MNQSFETLQGQVTAELGLRERKKERTRQLLADTARRLFSERGFEQVSVAEIARAAEVSQATVFNYFPNKEDLVYNRLETFENQLLSAIRDRPRGETVIAAFKNFILQPRGLLATADEAKAKGAARPDADDHRQSSAAGPRAADTGPVHPRPGQVDRRRDRR